MLKFLHYLTKFNLAKWCPHTSWNNGKFTYIAEHGKFTHIAENGKFTYSVKQRKVHMHLGL